MVWVVPVVCTLLALVPIVVLVLAPRGGPPVSVRVEGQTVVAEMCGLYPFLALRRRVEVPASAVVDVVVDADARKRVRGLRVGTYVPGGTIAGTFTGRGYKDFWAVQRQQALVIELRDQKYTRLILEVEDPHRTAQLLRPVG